MAKGSTTVTVSLKGANSATFTVENSGKGDYILFGHYRQKPPQTGGDNVDVEEWESQPIEWQILDIDTVNNRVLLLSRYGLDVKRFDENSNVWADSEIRRWLNGDFYYNAFDKLERDKIKPVGIVFNADGSDYYNFDNDTYRVFLLSKAEAEEYFDNDKRKCKPTEYAEKKDANVNSDGYCFWWLRSHSLNYNYYVYYADYFGSISLFNVSSIYFVVRPALWINL